VKKTEMMGISERAICRPQGRAALSRSASSKSPALLEVADWLAG